MKKIFAVCLMLIGTCLYSYLAQACSPVTWPIQNTSTFITQFEEAAYCHCSSSGFPYDFCKNKLGMHGIYSRMIVKYHSRENACHAQSDIPADLCIVEWNSYCGYVPGNCA